MALPNHEVSAVTSTIVGTAGGVKRGQTEITTKARRARRGKREMKLWVSGLVFVAVHYRLRYPFQPSFPLIRRSKMRKLSVAVLIVGFCLCFGATESEAYTASPQAAYAAMKSTPHAIDAAASVATVPSAASNLLYLPLGAVKLVLSPLPGISAGSAMNDIGRGVQAPFQIIAAVLKLPFTLLSSVSRMPLNALPL
jgi:hypothetical protein